MGLIAIEYRQVDVIQKIIKESKTLTDDDFVTLETNAHKTFEDAFMAMKAQPDIAPVRYPPLSFFIFTAPTQYLCGLIGC